MFLIAFGRMITHKCQKSHENLVLQEMATLTNIRYFVITPTSIFEMDRCPKIQWKKKYGIICLKTLMSRNDQVNFINLKIWSTHKIWTCTNRSNHQPLWASQLKCSQVWGNAQQKDEKSLPKIYNTFINVADSLMSKSYKTVHKCGT